MGLKLWLAWTPPCYTRLKLVLKPPLNLNVEYYFCLNTFVRLYSVASCWCFSWFWPCWFMVLSFLGNTAWIQFVLYLFHCAWTWKGVTQSPSFSTRSFLLMSLGEFVSPTSTSHAHHYTQSSADSSWIWISRGPSELSVCWCCCSSCHMTTCLCLCMPGVTWHNTGDCLQWMCFMWHILLTKCR